MYRYIYKCPSTLDIPSNDNGNSLGIHIRLSRDFRQGFRQGQFKGRLGSEGGSENQPQHAPYHLSMKYGRFKVRDIGQVHGWCNAGVGLGLGLA